MTLINRNRQNTHSYTCRHIHRYLLLHCMDQIYKLIECQFFTGIHKMNALNFKTLVFEYSVATKLLFIFINFVNALTTIFKYNYLYLLFRNIHIHNIHIIIYFVIFIILFLSSGLIYLFT